MSPLKRFSLAFLLLIPVGCTKAPQTLLDASASAHGIRNGTSAAGKFENVGAFRLEGSFECTGTLISPSVVLTAAHCATETVLPDLHFVRDLNGSEIGTATDYRIHPKYTDFGTPNLPATLIDDPSATVPYILPSGGDLALIKLSTRFKNWKPISLAGTSFAAGEDLTVVGFGQDERGVSGVKKFGSVRFDQLLLSVGLDSVNSSVTPPQISYINFANGQIHGVPGAANQVDCNGDSGGPVMKKVGDNWNLVGVVSWGYFEPQEGVTPAGNPYFLPKNTCSRSKDGFYTNVATFESWIRTEKEKLDPAGGCLNDDNDGAGTLEGGCLIKQGSNGVVLSKVATVSIDSNTVQRFGRSAATTYCDNLNEGGKSDWVLPTRTQLESAALNGAFDQANLGNERYYWYWTATGSGLSPDTGTAVNLKTGQVHVGYPLHVNYPLAVVCARNTN